MAGELTTTQATRLAELEGTIDADKAGFVRVGLALIEIRESKLYREQAETFEAYCQLRWEFTRRHANRLMEAADAVAELSAATEKGDTRVPSAETGRVATALAKAPKGERVSVMKEAAAEAKPDKRTGKPKVTAKDVHRVVAKRAEPKVEPEPTAAPIADRVGAPLPAHIAEAFANAARHDNIKTLLASLTRDLNYLLGPADGSPARGGELLGAARVEILSHLRSLKDLTTPMRPHAVCPHCKGQKRSCDACKGLGWLAKSQYEQVPADMRADMKPAA